MREAFIVLLYWHRATFFYLSLNYHFISRLPFSHDRLVKNSIGRHTWLGENIRVLQTKSLGNIYLKRPKVENSGKSNLRSMSEISSGSSRTKDIQSKSLILLSSLLSMFKVVYGITPFLSMMLTVKRCRREIIVGCEKWSKISPVASKCDCCLFS